MSLKTYTFDENSLRMALIFPIVYGYWRADFAFFFAVWRLSIAIAGLATRTGISQTQASLVGLGSMIAWWNASEIFIFSLKYSLFWNIIKNVKRFGLSSFSGVKEIVRKALQSSRRKIRENKRNREHRGSEYITHHLLATKQLNKNHNYLVQPERQIVKR